ncbi:MAG: crossover junction endodeoxyribonuclease RuvC [Planctomycetes bacterium]|nr:crossover junction endodeoxyribonuclease RuvC [Planctomycetota bacterium]
MRVFGIDPGSARLGYGVVDQASGRSVVVDHGVLRASRSIEFARRLGTLYQQLLETLRRHAPDVVAIEEVFYGRNPRTAIKIGECRGVALLAAVQVGAQIVEYATRDVKQAVVGHGGARKQQVLWMIAREFGLDPGSLGEDAADALALCLTHVQRTRIHVAAP